MSHGIWRLLVLVLLAACTPEIEVTMPASAIVQSISDTPQTVEFEARIEEKYTAIDDKQRTEIEAIAAVLENAFPDADVDLSFGGQGYKIDVEGTLVIDTKQPASGAPWYFHASQRQDGKILVELAQGTSWRHFADALGAINIFARAGDFVPMEIKLRRAKGKLIVGGAYVDGRPTGGYSETILTGKKVTIAFAQGLGNDYWKDAPASFLLDLE